MALKLISSGKIIELPSYQALQSSQLLAQLRNVAGIWNQQCSKWLLALSFRQIFLPSFALSQQLPTTQWHRLFSWCHCSCCHTYSDALTASLSYRLFKTEPWRLKDCLRTPRPLHQSGFELPRLWCCVEKLMSAGYLVHFRVNPDLDALI